MQKMRIAFRMEGKRYQTIMEIPVRVDEEIAKALMTDQSPWQRVAVRHVEELIREMSWLAGYAESRLLSVEMTNEGGNG